MRWLSRLLVVSLMACAPTQQMNISDPGVAVPAATLPSATAKDDADALAELVCSDRYGVLADQTLVTIDHPGAKAATPANFRSDLRAEVWTDQVTMGGYSVDFATAAAEQKQIAEATGLDKLVFKGELLLAIDTQAPMASVAEVLHDARTHGFHTVHVIVAKSGAKVVPQTGTLQERVAQHNAERKSALDLCPSALQAYAEAMTVPPELMCSTLTEGLPSALESCSPEARAQIRRVADAFNDTQVPTMVITLPLAPAGEGQAVAADSTWGQSAEALLGRPTFGVVVRD